MQFPDEYLSHAAKIVELLEGPEQRVYILADSTYGRYIRVYLFNFKILAIKFSQIIEKILSRIMFLTH